MKAKKGSSVTKKEEKPPGCQTSLKEVSFFVDKDKPNHQLKISYEINSDNFKLKISDKLGYSVNYPPGVLSALNEGDREILLDNFVYTRTIPLAVFCNEPLCFQSSKPIFKDFVDDGVVKDLPRISQISKKGFKDLLLSFKDSLGNGKIVFQNGKSRRKLLIPPKTSAKSAVLGLSFGKDSLLSYALAKEIGLECHPVFINDMENYNYNEFKHKKKIAHAFSKEQNQPVFHLSDETDNIFRTEEITRNQMEKVDKLDMTNAMLLFTIELIPLAYFHQAKYILFGNERNYSDYFLNSQKARVYHAYDQSRGYLKRKNYYLSRLTNNIRIISLIEPLYNLAEMKILTHRYPYLLKYVMSCSDRRIENNKWCGHCEVCAEMFLYSAAFGKSPKKIGITKNLFGKEYQYLYPLFAADKSPSAIYQNFRVVPSAVEEQLLAFLLAYRNGQQGELIDLFKSSYLKLAEKRERKLRKKFFGIHPTTLPNELKEKVLRIFKEELQDLA